MESFSHTELDKENFKSDIFLENLIKEGKFFTSNTVLKKVELDDSFPKYILKNKKKFDHLILK